ncbi:MAG: hypothetical protein LBF61_02700 [Azoarcus sp.]|jgi:hypothetical protein|nr:hypothetical protein [Azoarcus sp.]
MADLADLAQAEQERLAATSAPYRKPAAPAATEFCLNCGAPVPAGKRWCGVECRDDWEYRETLRYKQLGG